MNLCEHFSDNKTGNIIHNIANEGVVLCYLTFVVVDFLETHQFQGITLSQAILFLPLEICGNVYRGGRSHQLATVTRGHVPG